MIASVLKNLAVRISDSPPFELVLRPLERRNRRHNQLRVLAYHRIDHVRPGDHYYPGLISATPDAFASQMQTVADRYHVCSMQDVVDAAQQRRRLPPDSVLLTFDDATVDFSAHAWPVLRKLRLPAVVFVPTAYPEQHDRHFWWDRLYRAITLCPDKTRIRCPDGDDVRLTSAEQRRKTFRRLKEVLKTIPHEQFETVLSTIAEAAGVPDPAHNNVMDWQTLRELAAEGVTLAPHTHTHPMLNQLSAAQIEQEIRKSSEVLQAQTGSTSPTLAYPAGGVNDEVVTVTRQQGIELAFTTRRGINDQTFRDQLRLNRINVGARTTAGLLRLQMANWGK